MAEHETRIHRNRPSLAISGAVLIAVYNASVKGDVTWVLDEEAQRVAAIVPADTAEFVLASLPPWHGRDQQGSIVIYGNDEEGFTISSGGAWLPGIYDTRAAAQYAFRLDTAVLQRLSDAICRSSGGRTRIASADLTAARDTRQENQHVTDPSDAWAAEVDRLRAQIASGQVTRDAAVSELLAFTAANGIAITRKAAETLIGGESGPTRS